MYDQILALYSKGMTNREIVQLAKEMYDADISASLISRVTENIIEQFVEWQSKPLNPPCPSRLF